MAALIMPVSHSSILLATILSTGQVDVAQIDIDTQSGCSQQNQCAVA
jgi:hypothetical protein